MLAGGPVKVWVHTACRHKDWPGVCFILIGSRSGATAVMLAVQRRDAGYSFILSFSPCSLTFSPLPHQNH